MDFKWHPFYTSDISNHSLSHKSYRF